MSWKDILKNVDLDEDNCCGRLGIALELLFENLIFTDFSRFVEQNKNNCKVLVPEIEKILGEGMSYFKRKYIIEPQLLSISDESEIYEVIKDVYSIYTDCNEDLTMLSTSEWA